MDPLEVLPEELYDSILQYLSWKDILELSLVTKGWYEKLGKSNVCMEKLKVRYGNHTLDWNPDCSLDCVLQSTRKYRRLTLFHGLDSLYAVDAALLSSKFSGSLEYIEQLRDFPDTKETPKLNTIIFKKTNLSSYWPISLYPDGILSANIKHIERLEFNASVEADSIPVLKELLKQSKRLKVLQVHDSIFEGPVIEYEFPVLNTLRLDFEDMMSKAGLDFIMAKIPELTTLYIRCSINSPRSNESTEPVINETVINLSCDDVFARNYLSRFKNVQHLIIFFLDIGATRTILSCHSISTVRFNYIDRSSSAEILDMVNAQDRITFDGDFSG